MIKVENVDKIIKNNKVLENISFEFKFGETVLIQGHNGSGKTMLLRLLSSLIKPTSGTVKIPGNSNFGVMIENPSFLENETAFYNLKFLASLNGKINDSDIEKFLREFNLYQYKDNKVKTFSLGMKQRLAFSQAIMEDQEILLLDEPFNGIDDENLIIVVDKINEARVAGKLVVIATHGAIENVVIDQTIKMSDGKIVDVY